MIQRAFYAHKSLTPVPEWKNWQWREERNWLYPVQRNRFGSPSSFGLGTWDKMRVNSSMKWWVNSLICLFVFTSFSSNSTTHSQLIPLPIDSGSTSSWRISLCSRAIRFRTSVVANSSANRSWLKWSCACRSDNRSCFACSTERFIVILLNVSLISNGSSSMYTTTTHSLKTLSNSSVNKK